MESTIFITPSRRFDEISRLIGNGLKKNGLNEQWKTRFNLPEKDYFLGYSWSYENVSDGVVILLEISKYYLENKKDNKAIPPRITKSEIIRHAGNFRKYVESELPISEMKIQQFHSSDPLSVKYELGNGISSPSKRAAVSNPFKLNALPEIRVYYPTKFSHVSVQACRMLAQSLKEFGITGTIKPVPYGEELPLSEDAAFECAIIPPNIEDDAAKSLISELKERSKGIHIFDFGKTDNNYKYINLAAGVLYNSGSELWRVHGLDQDNSVYIGIDLGHESKPQERSKKRSKICLTFIDKNGRELSGYRKIIDNLPLNERQLGQWEARLLDTIVEKLVKIKKEVGFKNVIIHKDGRILENPDTIYSVFITKI